MWAWLDKTPILKLIDIGILGFVLILLGVMVFFVIKSLKKIGEPSVELDDKGKLRFSLNNKTAESQAIATLNTLLEIKDKEIASLKEILADLNHRFAVLEAQVNKDKILAEYHKEHKIPMINHSVFFNLKKNFTGGIDFNLEALDSVSNVKIQIAKIYLEQCKMPVFYERLQEWVKGFDECITDIEASERLYKVLEHLFSWIEEYSRKAETVLVELEDGRTFRGIPSAFIDGFNEWHEPHVKIVVYKIKDILYNAFYETWQLKLIVILDHIDTAFYLTIKDAEKTLQSINGKVEKQITEKLNQKEKK